MNTPYSQQAGSDKKSLRNKAAALLWALSPKRVIPSPMSGPEGSDNWFRCSERALGPIPGKVPEITGLLPQGPSLSHPGLGMISF